MGAWGPAIFSDDLASDVRGDFRDLIGDGLSAEEATKRLAEEYRQSLLDPDESPVFWMALAAAQWNLGGLLPDVRDKAIELIDAGADLHLWQDTPDVKKRVAAEKQLRDQLTSEPPPPKKVPKPWRQESPFDQGLYFLYRHRQGNRLMFRVVDVHRDKGGSYPVAEAIDWRDDEAVPPARKLKKLPTHTYLDALTKKKRPLTLILIRKGKRDDPTDRIEVVGSSDISPNQRSGGVVIFWQHLDDFLSEKGLA